MGSILTLALYKNNCLSQASREIIGMAHKIASIKNAQVATVITGSNISFLGQDLISCGAEIVYMIEHTCSNEHHNDAYLSAIMEIVKITKPELIILPDESISRDLAPRLAWRTYSTLITDCIECRNTNDSITFVKPVYGGKALAYIRSVTPATIITVRPGTQESLQQEANRKIKCISVKSRVECANQGMTLIERIEEEEQKINLEEATIVVSGGRGLGGIMAFNQLKQLADILGGAVGASRGAVDAGWIPASYQVGQTGKIVAPNLYIAIAISGSSQHVSGMIGSKFVVAINRDAEAPIFKMANVGVIDDYRNVLPAFLEELKRTIQVKNDMSGCQ